MDYDSLYNKIRAERDTGTGRGEGDISERKDEVLARHGAFSPS